ncbi:MAG: serine/threonine-protein kinase [Pirellulales bacterium]
MYLTSAFVNNLVYMDSENATVDLVSSAAPSPHATRGSLDVSQVAVGVVAGRRQKFADETAALLRRRLLAAASLVAVVLAAAFVGNLVVGITTYWGLRFAVVGIAVAAAAGLRFHPQLSLGALRIVEGVIFGAVVFQLALMMWTRLGEFIAAHDGPTLIASRHQYLMAWCILIFIYGTLMPNTWKRAAVILLPMSFLPYAIVACLQRVHPETTALLAQAKAESPLPMPIVAALVASFAAHVINAARREAFKARQFGQYRLLDRLGVGGMGEVYRAEHTLLKRPCAIKLIKPASETDAVAVARFEKEVKTTARLTHWNTIEIYDYGRTDDGTFYYVMELLPGMSLEELVAKHGPLPPGRVVHLLRQICGALHEAHAVGLIHRDIKPANIFASQRGGVHDVAKLLDFGLVKERRDSSDDAARSGKFSGTPLYMAPEQAWSYDDVDGRADLYSLGAVAYCLLTGRPPFVSNSVMELLAAHQSEPVPPPSKFQAAVPPDLDQIVLRCLAKSPADRFADADALRSALAACSVANAWTEQDAASWWRNESQQESPAKLVLATPTLDDSRSPAPSSMAATVDAVTVEASASKRDD